MRGKNSVNRLHPAGSAKLPGRDMTEKQTEPNGTPAPEARHTPGPWKVLADNRWHQDAHPNLQHRFITTENAWFDGDYIEDGNIIASLRDTREIQANAELIARAPEMLAANAELVAENKRLHAVISTTARACSQYKEQRDQLFAALRRIMPHAERGVKVANAKMVGSLYPALNHADLEEAQAAIRNVEGGI